MKNLLLGLLSLVVIGLTTPTVVAQEQLKAAEQVEAPKTQEEVVTEVLLEQVWSHEDRTETPESRKTRAQLMGPALVSAARKIAPKWVNTLIAATISLWWHEARFSFEVHSGGLSRYGSDQGKAKCFGQVHERAVGLTKEPDESMEAFRQRQTDTWKSLTGVTLEATTACAEATMRRFMSAIRSCAQSEDRWASAFGHYGNTICQPLATSKQRVLMMSKLAVQLERQ